MVFLREWLSWCSLYLQHTFVMMYWITLPGLLVSAGLSLRYRTPLRERLVKQQTGLWAWLSAVGVGVLDGDARRPDRFGTMEELRSRGVSAGPGLAYLLAGQTMSLPVIGLFTVLVGLEFGVGLFVAGLVMIAFATRGLHLLGLEVPRDGRRQTHEGTGATDEPGDWTWSRLLGSTTGWGAILRWIGRMFRSTWLPSVAGLLLSGLVLALDMHESWILPASLADETAGAALAGAFLAPILASIAWLLPLGNLVVAASIWKTWTLGYPGVLSFALAASFHPFTLRTWSARLGVKRTVALGLLLYLAGCLGALAVSLLWHLAGLQVTHVPWFRDLVDRIMMALPFTMLGTGGMAGARMISH